MKHTLTAAIIILMASCMPMKSQDKVQISITCDSCYINVDNGVKVGEDWWHELVYSGDIIGYQQMECYRYSQGLNCLRVTSFTNYTNNPATIIMVENGDTTCNTSMNNFGTFYCH